MHLFHRNFLCTSLAVQVAGVSSSAMKKPSADWSSSGWDADDSWSNEKEADGQGQSSPGEEGWGHDWEEEAGAPGSKNVLPEGVRLASEYDWDSSKGSGPSDPFASVSQRAAPTATVRSWAGVGLGGIPAPFVHFFMNCVHVCAVFSSRLGVAGGQMPQETGAQRRAGSRWTGRRVSPSGIQLDS